ncbi:DUF2207 domain-containing protein [Cohaesibacter celericrescens]|uniref:DUF2207 domain-containing protein n=1 Tax=Cohaesibacter celericrescens TaxID=2067669 RepID=A0A2N5XKY2_9HYPH|nr:DUF2207 domain-containing protein [Cohaesibacter celericrescens]PLW75108.1 hypothetical protein C0081_22755 [Cohaesibacter celericrescens]
MTLWHIRTKLCGNLPGALRALLFVCLAMVCVPDRADAQSGERITNYNVDISVNKDRSVSITETIEVTALGQAIKRGILRDIPVLYRDDDGSSLNIDLTVTSVRRDGQSEPYDVSYEGRYVRLRIGSAEVFLPSGQHTYEISYTVQDSIGFFEQVDEIYWNAIGTEWPFWIDNAQVTVQLPQGADIQQYSVYTGNEGARGDSYEISENVSDRISFRSTRSFAPSEGMTVSVGWQKGIVSAPSEAELQQAEMLKNSPMILLGLGAFLQMGWLYWAWLRVGKDPVGGAIIPRYRAPKDLSPAVSSYVSGLGSFQKSQNASFMAALINLAIKKFVTIDNSAKKVLIQRLTDPADAKINDLPAGEKALFNSLMGSRETARFADMTYAVMSRIMSAFSSALDDETNQVYFHRNNGYMVPGFLLAIVGIIGFIVASVMFSPPYFPPVLELICAAGLIALFVVFRMIWRAVLGKGKIGFGKVTIVPFFVIMFVLPVFFGEFDGDLIGLGDTINLPAIGLIVLMLLGLWFFSGWMKAPTKLGREVLDEIEGLKLFMTVTVAKRAYEAEASGMPELTPKLYEDLLPYAIALGIEEAWSATFEDKVFSQLPADQSYHPSWYRGDRNSMSPVQSLAGLTQSMGTDLSSAMTPPASSSSGSSGGGSSGGGGGGGGGGGW